MLEASGNDLPCVNETDWLSSTTGYGRLRAIDYDLQLGTY